MVSLVCGRLEVGAWEAIFRKDKREDADAEVEIGRLGTDDLNAR